MLDLNQIKNYKKAYELKKENKVRERMLKKVPLVDLIHDIDTDTDDNNFSINIQTHGITDQGQTGRCWSFGALNILREKIIEKCNLEDFELSYGYIAFYDKLERTNNLLERLIKYKQEKRNNYDRYVSFLLENGIADGGYFNQFTQLIKKYGILPKNNFPETYASSNTYEINQILSRIIRKFYLELETTNDEKELKEKYMKKVYEILASLYGAPPEKFNFEYTDKDRQYHIDKNLTPHDFYKKYIGIDLEQEYVAIGSYEDELYQYYHQYQIEETSRISGTEDEILLNLPYEEINQIILRQLKAKEPVYFFCSTTSKRVEGTWIDTLERYGDIFDFDLTLNRNDILKANGITGGHVMVITGVDIVDGKPTKWKIENSWGEQFGKKGKYIATTEWMKLYIFKICIHKKYLTQKQLEILQQEPIKISKWNEKF